MEKVFDRDEVAKTVNSYLAEQEKENGLPFNWQETQDVDYLLSHLNTEETLLVAFDTIESIGSKDNPTNLVTCYSPKLGHSIILEWDGQCAFKDSEEFMEYLSDLHKDALKILNQTDK